MRASPGPVSVELPARVSGLFLLVCLTGLLGIAGFPLAHAWLVPGASWRSLFLAGLAGLVLERAGRLCIERTRARLLVEPGSGRTCFEIRLPWRRMVEALPDQAGLSAVTLVEVDGTGSEVELGLEPREGAGLLLAMVSPEAATRLAEAVAEALGGLPVRRSRRPMTTERAFQAVARGLSLLGLMTVMTLFVSRLVGP